MDFTELGAVPHFSGRKVETQKVRLVPFEIRWIVGKMKPAQCLNDLIPRECILEVI